ncbi:hypothetical protein ACHAWF_011065 [Thalassiosira exigua]
MTRVGAFLALPLLAKTEPFRRPSPAFAAALSSPGFLGAGDVAGVWRLSSRVAFLPPPAPPPPSRLDGDDDGSEDLSEGDDCGRTGRSVPSVPTPEIRAEDALVLCGTKRGKWRCDPSSRTVALVPDRPDDGDGRKVHDVLQSGTVDASCDDASDDESSLRVTDGIASVGRCFYPRSHPNFFDAPGPVHEPTAVGTFEMIQILGARNADLEEEGERESTTAAGTTSTKATRILPPPIATRTSSDGGSS